MGLVCKFKGHDWKNSLCTHSIQTQKGGFI